MDYKVTATWLSKKPNENGFVAAAITTFLLTLGCVAYWQNWGEASHWMPASNEGIFQNGLWLQMFTALFAHSDVKHLLSNSFLFFILGSFLAGYFGLLLFPLMAFLAGAAINLLVVRGMAPETRLLGASGIVFWMGGVWLALYSLLDQKRSIYQRSLRALGVALALFFPAEAFDPQTSYLSHWYGFIFGVLFGLIYYWWNRKTFLRELVLEPVIEDPDEIPIN